MTLAASDSSRINALERYRFLDTTTDETLDSLVRLAADVCGTSLARLSLVDRTSHEFRAGLDADARAIGRELSRCRPNAEADSSRVRFYAGIGVRASDGSAVGTLCVIDNLPRVFTDVQRRSLRTIAAQIGALLEARRQIERLKREACGVL
ncbi:MAG: GAF domain-containing protein, partial [Candidatus Eremiobacteraeota bacterium]|nr:GAF domain-containing protein [Candidatus Eremiobacteraeota bacterium]